MNSSQENLLIQAVEENKLEGVKRLLTDEKVNPNFQDSKGKAPIYYAAKKGNIQMLNVLIKGGADVNYPDMYGTTALMRAVWKKHNEAVKALIEKGADVNVQNIWGVFALKFAAQARNIEVVKVLIEAGADVNLRNNNGETALRAAIPYIEVVEALIAAGADVNIKYNDMQNTHGILGIPPEDTKFTALMFAARIGYIEVVKALIAAGANVNHKNDKGKTVLDIINNANNITVENKAKLSELINLAKIVDLLVEDPNNIDLVLPAELSISQARIIASRYKALLLKDDIKFNYEDEISKLTNNASIPDKLQNLLITILQEIEDINSLKAVDLLLENIGTDVPGLFSNESKSNIVTNEYKAKLLENGINEDTYQIYINKLNNNKTIPNEIKDQLVNIICQGKKDFDMFCSIIIFTGILDINIISDPLIGVIGEEQKAQFKNTELSLEDKEKIVDFYAQQGCKFTDQLSKYFNKEEHLCDEELKALRNDIESANIDFLKNNCSELLKNGYFELISDLKTILLPRSLKESLSPALKEYDELLADQKILQLDSSQSEAQDSLSKCEEKLRENHEEDPITFITHDDIPDNTVETTGDAETIAEL